MSRSTYKLKNIIKLIIFFPLLFLLLIARLFIKIKIVEIETRAIGHMSLSIEIFLCEVKNNIYGEDNFYLAYPNKFISNKFLYDKIKTNFFIVPRFLFEPIFYFFSNQKIYNIFGKKFISDYRHWRKRENNNSTWQESDIHNLLPKFEPIITFNNEETQLIKRKIEKIGFKDIKNYICFHHRTPAYYVKRKIINQPDFNLRDLRKENYGKVFDFYRKKKTYIICMGERKKNLQNIEPNVFNYNSLEVNDDMLDIFLVFNCKYMVCDGSGISNVAIMNRKKRVYINYVQLSNINISDSIYTPIITLKKFKSLKTNEYLPYSYVLKNKLSEIAYVKNLNKLGYDIEDNSEEEIYQACREMEFHFDGREERFDDDLQEKFNHILSKNEIPRLKKTKISNFFLTKNKHFII